MPIHRPESRTHVYLIKVYTHAWCTAIRGTQ